MFTPVFEGKEFGYSLDTETGAYLLFSPKYEISLQLKDDDAKQFAEHIEILKRQNDKTLTERIEKVICIHLYFSSLPITEKTMTIIPVFAK
jgi:hypothetical protein